MSAQAWPDCPIKLVITDLDGCLTGGSVHGWDYAALAAVRQRNHAAATSPEVPFVTVCSGRQGPFVEAVLQAIGGVQPAIFENGCGMVVPPSQRSHATYLVHPAITPAHRAELAAGQRIIEHDLLDDWPAEPVFGKSASLSYYPTPPTTPLDLYTAVQERFAAEGLSLEIAHTPNSVDITPPGVDKGAGVRWLLQVIGTRLRSDLSNVAGVGDANNDLAFLRVVGLPAAPSNASREVQYVARYVSGQPRERGLLDIIERCIAHNREVLRTHA